MFRAKVYFFSPNNSRITLLSLVQTGDKKACHVAATWQGLIPKKLISRVNCLSRLSLCRLSPKSSFSCHVSRVLRRDVTRKLSLVWTAYSQKFDWQLRMWRQEFRRQENENFFILLSSITLVVASGLLFQFFLRCVSFCACVCLSLGMFDWEWMCLRYIRAVFLWSCEVDTNKES